MTFSKQQIKISNPQERPIEISLEEIIDKLLVYLDKYLPNFSEYLKKNTNHGAENSITQQLSTYLETRNKGKKIISNWSFHFRNQHALEGTHRSSDIGILVANQIINDLYFIFEAKRLPPDNSSIRQFEYINGKKGGIERFKSGVHPTKYGINGMFGYMQKENTTHWLSFLNTHIETLETNPIDTEVKWSKNEQLEYKSNFGKVDYLISKHASGSDTITLHHYWIDLQ